jgi:hypothetical protein
MNDALFSKPSKDYIRKYGAVFTPTKWAYKIVFDNCYKKWIDGATVLDPTAGDGVFIKAFLEIANNEGITITNEMISRLYGIELNPYYVEAFYRSVKDTFDIEFPRDNFIQGDIFFIERDIKADILVGNPPWVNFTDLDEYYKERIKHLFLYWGLVKNPQDLLLGNARTDIAALVLLKVIHSNLKDNGSAIFFVPLSIFQNDGANQEFRNYNTRGIDFCVEKILDFNGEKIFDDILGRYGVAFFKRNEKQSYPIKYFVLNNNVWDVLKAKPLFNRTDALTVFQNDKIEAKLNSFSKITLPKNCQPRQGINTCGANDIFFFDTFDIIDDNKVKLINKMGEQLIINKEYVFPLTVSSTLKTDSPIPEKLVLIPHFENGKPLDIITLQKEEELYQYLLKHKSELQNRKGVLINSWIKKGYWWALMGIGTYSYAKYKIMWKAFGDNQFSPKLLKPDAYFSTWQGNQSLNAYIGVSDFNVAISVYQKLRDPIIQEYLSSLRMQGTCNWAQPGRIKKIIQFV